MRQRGMCGKIYALLSWTIGIVLCRSGERKDQSAKLGESAALNFATGTGTRDADHHWAHALGHVSTYDTIVPSSPGTTEPATYNIFSYVRWYYPVAVPVPRSGGPVGICSL